jgi:hypothetical protein
MIVRKWSLQVNDSCSNVTYHHVSLCIDSIRPDWEAKLAAVRAAVTRRANRRIIMRQVGDRLIPVGVTSGRVHPIPTGEGQEGGEVDGSVSRRSRRHRNNGGQPDIGQLLGQMGLGGQDLEEVLALYSDVFQLISFFS